MIYNINKAVIQIWVLINVHDIQHKNTFYITCIFYDFHYVYIEGARGISGNMSLGFEVLGEQRL